MSPFERSDAPLTSSQVSAPVFYGPRRYRPDLDGLRGYAVIIAVLFHYGLPVPGGFIGLDIFFVLSGYLIGGIVFSDASNRGFSFARFYEYRVRRIAPAALCVLVVSFVFAQLLLLPSQYEYFAKSALANLYFATNHLFLSEDGYFDPASENKPLLHTWSLAVEEQFYFVFPLVVLLLYRWRGARAWLPAIVVLATISFAVNLAVGIHDPDADYFLAPTRAWELLIGAAVALLPLPGMSAYQRNLLAITGLAMIVVSTFCFDRDMVYPGYAGVLPCFGSALAIYAGAGGASAVNRWLGNRPLRFFGVISYSFYLWHWPTLVFARYLLVEPPVLWQRLLLLGGTLVMSILSWKYVEQPFRAGRGMPARRVLRHAATAVSVVLMLGLAVRWSNGAPTRPQFDPAVVAVERETFRTGDCFVNGAKPRAALHLDRCRFGTPGVPARVLLWGDSHARQWQAAMIDESSRHRAAFVQATTSTCPPAMNFDLRRRPGCKPNNDRVVAWLVHHPEVRTVVLAGRWASYANEPELPRAMAATVATLRARGMRVYTIDAIPTYTRPVPIILTAWRWLHGDTATVRMAKDSIDSNYAEDRRAFSATFSGVTLDGILAASSRLCDATSCAIRADGQPLYFDQTHLSRYAVRRFAAVFDPVFTRSTG